MSSDTSEPLTEYQWAPQPGAAKLISKLLVRFRQENPAIERFAQELLKVTGTRLADWVDAIRLPRDNSWGLQPEDLTIHGFESSDNAQAVWENKYGIFPKVIFAAADHSGLYALMFRVENVDDACRYFGVTAAEIGGPPGSAFRTVEVARENNVALVAVERHGYQGFDRLEDSSAKIAAACRVAETFAQRKRNFATNKEGFQHTIELVRSAVDEVGVDRACDAFFGAERNYWMSRNHAARTQYALQQALGLGWANHDHHTYRSSRECFHWLVAILETLGFHCRERFYAGEEAGWGAQVLEQPNARIVVFADVDMSPAEIAGDFAHEGLPQRDEMGTVGLWCRLHGESILQAGMHHLECQFDFDAARARLAEEGVETLAPFTDFPFLRQAFTQGEVWQVDAQRIQAALQAGQITKQQAEQFQRNGAIGSHLEILERNDGYKGFNQTGVSDIIARTDPRKW